MISELNADMAQFWQDLNGKFRAVRSIPRTIGRTISVKELFPIDQTDRKIVNSG